MRKTFYITGSQRNIHNILLLHWQKFPEWLYFGLAPLYMSDNNVTLDDSVN